YASARMLNSLTGVSESACILITAALVGVYTFAGGLKAVVYTDVIQCAVMIGGCLLVLVIGLHDLGGIGGLQEKLAAMGERTQNHATLIIPADAKSPFPWPAILFGLAFILSPAYWIGNQAIMQRSLGAKSQFHAQAAYVWGALLKIIIPVIIVIPGLIALAKFPELDTPDAAFPTLAAKMLPTGIRGLFLAAFMAALMSSVDSYLNASATVATHDFYLRFINRQADDHRILVVGRTVTLVLMGWGIAFAFFIRQTGENTGIYTIFQTLMSFFQGPALAMILTGFFWKRANGIGALSGFLCGIICAVGLFVLHNWHESFGIDPLFQIEEPFLYFSIWSFVTALVVIIIVSFLTRPEPEEKTAFLKLGSQPPTPDV
ncbi:MAG: sodium/solute symporter, partial [Verrucomicrobia bacterium]|nr:sodium/solute symporter [Verrucomicrobiota bacterium]